MILVPKVSVAGKTHKGLVRPGNEDYLHLDGKNNVYAVCDGMGGHQAGEVASMTASAFIGLAFNQFRKQLLDDPALAIDHVLPPNGELLLISIRLANRTIFNRSIQDQKLSGMGTTIVAVTLEANIMSIAHVGDSRAYRLGKRELQPLTRDHSWVAEMQEASDISPDDTDSFIGKNVITRALGVKDTVQIDYRIIRVQPGDIFILCSDGLCGFADDDEIFLVADKNRRDIHRMTDNLIQMANDRGGMDNVTVVVFQILEVEESQLPEIDVITLPPETPSLLEVEDAWVTTLSESEVENESPEEAGSSAEKGNTLLMIAIFALFAVVAVLVVYFSQAD